MEIKVAEAQKLTRLKLTRILEIRVWAFISYDKVYSGAPRARERSPNTYENVAIYLSEKFW